MPEPVEGTFLFLPVISTPLNHRIIYYYTRCLSVVEGTFSILISVPEPVEGTFSILISVPEPVEGTFSILISVPEPVEGTLFLFY